MKAHAYPRLQEQPDYQVEAEKLRNYNERLSEAQRQLDELNAQHAHNMKAGSSDAQIDHADQLIAKNGHVHNLREQAAAQSRIIEALRRAIPEQRNKIRDITHKLSIEARQHFQPEHKRLVRQIIDSVLAVNSANEAQRKFVEEARAMGYNESVLTDWTSTKIGRDVNDPNCEDTGFYWLRSAREYVAQPDDSTPDELHKHSTRKGKLASLLG